MIYEGEHSVPLVFRYDKHFASGEERNQLVGLNNVYSTVCDLIGVDVPKHSAQDSISFADYLIPGTRSTSSHRKP